MINKCFNIQGLWLNTWRIVWLFDFLCSNKNRVTDKTVVHIAFQQNTDYMLQDPLLTWLFTFSFLTVSSFSEAGCQQTPDNAAEEETLQEPNHPGLQNFGRGSYQYGRGNCCAFNHFISCFIVPRFISLQRHIILLWAWDCILPFSDSDWHGC